MSLLVSRSGSIVSGPNIVGAAFQSSFPVDSEAWGFDGSRYLLVYGDANASVRPPQLSGLLISPTTGLPDGAPFTISNTNIYNRDGPAVGFDGTNYLVVWGEFGLNPTGLRAIRISAAGALLDPTPLLLMDVSSLSKSSNGVCCDLSPTVTFDGTNYLVAYRDPRGAAPYSNTATVAAARVSPAGVLLDGTASMPSIVVGSATNIVVDRVRSPFINGAHWLAWGSGNLIILECFAHIASRWGCRGVAQWLYLGAAKRCWGNGPVAGRSGGWFEWWLGDVVASAAKRHKLHLIVVDADLLAGTLKHSAVVGSTNGSKRERCAAPCDSPQGFAPPIIGSEAVPG